MKKTSPQSDFPEFAEEFLLHYNREQRGLYTYIRAILFSSEDVEDIFQETCIALWRSFGDFEKGTDFGAWARQIARYRVLAHCKRRKADRHSFSEGLVEMLATEVEDQNALLLRRQDALNVCLERLSNSDRDLIKQRYYSGKTTVQIAEQGQRPLATLYKKLRRIRKNLLACVSKSLSWEDHARTSPE